MSSNRKTLKSKFKFGVSTLIIFFLPLVNLNGQDIKKTCDELQNQAKLARELMDKNNYVQSNVIFTKTIENFFKKKCKEKSILGNVYLGKANLMTLTFITDSSTYYLDLALKIADETKDENLKSRINTTIGMMMNQSGQYEKALIHFNETAKILENLKESPEKIRRKAISAYNLGLTYSNLKNSEQAILKLKETLSLGKKIDFKPILIDAHGVLALELKNQKDTSWTSHLDTAIQLSITIKNSLKIAQGYIFWANHYFENGVYSESIKYAERALNNISDSSNNFLKPKIYKLLAESNFNLSEYEKSANYYKNGSYYNKYYDSVNNENIVYRFEEKLKFEKEITAQRVDNIMLEKKINKTIFILILFSFIVILFIVYYIFKIKINLLAKAVFKLSTRNDNNSALMDQDPLLTIWLKISDLLITEKIYLDKDLTAEKLAKLTGTNLNYLAKCIKIYSDSNFKTYINKLRVEHSKNLILSTKQGGKLNFNQISEDSGFNSIQTFYRVFKAFTGSSPMQWLEKTRKNP